tara:strand:- start:162 stop:641 length:480 start_codon:yes stop_codon:yes gene_type:complete
MNKVNGKRMSVSALRQMIRQMVKDELSSQVKEGNVNFDKKGRFTSKGNASCVSSYFTDGKRKRVGGKLTSKSDTGRGENKTSGKGSRRCYDDAELFETDFSVLLDEAVKRNKMRGMDIEDLKNRCRGIGLRTINDFLDLVDQIEKAKRGAKAKSGIARA